MSFPNVSQIIATTLRNRADKVVDNMSKSVVLFNRLAKKGNVKFEADGGRTIFLPLEYAENAGFAWYSGYEALNVSPTDHISAAEFDWKQASVPISMSGLEQIQNSGKNAVIKLAAAKIRNGERTFKNQMGAATYADGTGSAGKEIGGLRLLVASSPSTGTVGGINRANWTFWRNTSQSATTVIGAAPSATNFQIAMRSMWLATSKNNEAPDLIVQDNNHFNHFWGSMQAIQRVTNSGDAQAGFTSLKFVGADVVLDGGQGGACPANTSYFLNTDYLQFVTHKDRNMEVVGGERVSLNQDASVQIMLWAGNMAVSNAAMQGVLTN